MAQSQLNIQTQRMLLADWFVRLARDSGLDFNQRGQGGSAFTIGDPTDLHVVAHFTETAPFLSFQASDLDTQEQIETLSEEAARRVEQGDLGGHVWYSVDLHELQIHFSGFSPRQALLQRLGTQQRITGWRRLGSDIVLEFTEEIPEGWAESNPILAPKAIVRAHLAAPGPCAGDFSSQVAHGALETVGAICAFALGRPLELPPSLFPSLDSAIEELDRRRLDSGVGTLARRGISLDIFSPIGRDGGIDIFQRVRGALISFDAAVQQDRDPVAAILYVVAAECLTTPPTSWRQNKLTKRFIEFFDQLMPKDLNTIIAHGNFEAAFAIRKGNRADRPLRRELLDQIYGYRSGQLHAGLTPSYRGMGIGQDWAADIRRGLLADFAEAAILRYLAAPRSSLIGHPALTGEASEASGQQP